MLKDEKSLKYTIEFKAIWHLLDVISLLALQFCMSHQEMCVIVPFTHYFILYMLIFTCDI